MQDTKWQTRDAVKEAAVFGATAELELLDEVCALLMRKWFHVAHQLREEDRRLPLASGFGDCQMRQKLNIPFVE